MKILGQSSIEKIRIDPCKVTLSGNVHPVFREIFTLNTGELGFIREKCPKENHAHTASKNDECTNVYVSVYINWRLHNLVT